MRGLEDEGWSYVRDVSHRQRPFVLLALVMLLIVPLVMVPARTTPVRAASRILIVRPPFGYSAGSIRTVMSAQESVVLAKMATLSRSLIPNFGIQDVNITLHVEDTAESSPIYKMATNVLRSAQQILFRYTLIDGWPVDIVIGRTQKYIQDQLRSIGCVPELPAYDGQVVMGAALCNRHVIVMNLTGYLFLYRASQHITSEMETRTEPPISRIPYLIVDRDIASLAHEWAHVYRAWGARGNLQSDEPAWLREGWAEIIAGLARVKAYPKKYSYESFHAIALRHFFDWKHQCTTTLRSYRALSSFPTSCPYSMGALAVEYLLAKYGGPKKLLLAYRYENLTSGFVPAFRSVYGFSLTAFEREVDKYLLTIRSVS